MEAIRQFEAPTPDHEGEIARMVDEGGPALPEESAPVERIHPETPRTTIPVPRPEVTPQAENPAQGQ